MLAPINNNCGMAAYPQSPYDGSFDMRKGGEGVGEDDGCVLHNMSTLVISSSITIADNKENVPPTPPRSSNKKWRTKLDQNRRRCSSGGVLATESAAPTTGDDTMVEVTVINGNGKVKVSSIKKQLHKKHYSDESKKAYNTIQKKSNDKAPKNGKEKKSPLNKAVVVNIPSKNDDPTKHQKSSRHASILPSMDSNFVGHSSSTSSPTSTLSSSKNSSSRGSGHRRGRRNNRKNYKKKTNASSYSTNAGGASVLKLLGQYHATATPTSGFEANEGTYNDTFGSSGGCDDDEYQQPYVYDPTLIYPSNSSIPTYAVYDQQQQQQQYDTTTATTTEVAMPISAGGYYYTIPVMVAHPIGGEIYYSQQTEDTAYHPTSGYYPATEAYDGCNFSYEATQDEEEVVDEPSRYVGTAALNVSAPVFYPKTMSYDNINNNNNA